MSDKNKPNEHKKNQEDGLTEEQIREELEKDVTIKDKDPEEVSEGNFKDGR